MCGFVHSIFATVPETVTGCMPSYSAAKEWCAATPEVASSTNSEPARSGLTFMVRALCQNMPANSMHAAKDFRCIVLGLEGAIESAHMGHPDFRANGRIFATLQHDPTWGALMLTPEQQ